ncbi:NAD(P)/FAD-dependent oxidoreductase [Helicobacter mesocricetorum]|uniref:NAD(P)/FAD-dependent oxidoreductase n=1 Tax=Helicobacter mesocricetorum TaxID=87012 RepID=UPI000CF12E48|nr:NAD(P)/FAD-dependent oxidoreductase [Helicobacter mesocricetorum]
MKKVVLLGAGYANMSLIKALPSDIFEQYEFLLISNTPFHYFSVLLHEVASGVCESEVTLPLSSILPKDIRCIQDKVTKITSQKIEAQKNSYDYDYLVVGLGFQSDSFGIAGIKEYADSIVNYEGSLGLKQKIINSLRDYAAKNDLGGFNIAVCGAGFTGIEFIGSLVEELPQICKLFNIHQEKVKITCIEAMPNILPMFNPELSNSAKAYLEAKNIVFELGCKILECQSDGIIVEKEGQRQKIDSSLTIWTAGVKGNQVMEDSEFFTTQRSKVEVNTYLQPINQTNQESMQNIFVVGDCAAIKDPTTQRFYPPTAQIAMQQGKFLAKLLAEKLQGKNFSEEFSYKPKGTICSVGSQYAIGYVGKINIKGKIAVWLKRVIEATWSFKFVGWRAFQRGF